ncbi:hypothetical protein ACHAXR_008570 [Thalassiosira sp. AJA248-18]
MKQTILTLLVQQASLMKAASSPLGPLGSSSSCTTSCFLSNTFGGKNTRSSQNINIHQATKSIIPPSIHHNQWREDTTGSIFSLYASSISNNVAETNSKRRNSQNKSNKSSGARRKTKNSIAAGGGAAGTKNARRMKKSEIDDLVRGIGLQPVVQSSSKKKQNAITPINNTPKSHQKHDRTYHQQNPDPMSIIKQQSPPSISLQTQLDYSRHGHSALRSFLPQTVIQQLHSELLPYAASHAVSAWRQKVEVQLADSSDEYYRENARTIADNLKSIQECQDLLESLGMDPSSGDLPFLQHFNAWRAPDAMTTTPGARELCLSPYLAQSASILLDSSTIRLYQDSLFHKRAGDGWTPWHSDARMAPFDTSKMITFWIPLQEVPTHEDGGTGLLFVDGSHSDFALPYWNGVGGGREYDRLEERYNNGKENINGGVSHHMPLGLGDVTVHNGWTLHCADAMDCVEEGEDRYAFAITYVDGLAELREDVLLSSETDGGQENHGTTNDDTTPKGDKEDVWSFRSWVEEVKPRTEFTHPLVPIVWPPGKRVIE